MAGALSSAERLEKWAKDMNYYIPGAPDGCHFPPSSHFKLLCQGKNAKVWDFAIDHFHTQSRVRKVKAMLALRAQKLTLKPGMDHEQELTRHQLQQQLIEKSAAKRDLESRIALLESKVKAKEKLLLEKESQVSKIQQDIGMEQRVIGLTRKLKKAAQLQADEYRQLEPRLRQLLQDWDTRKEGNDIFNILMGDNQRNAKMEQAAAALLDKIKSFLQQHFAATKSDSRGQSKEAIWQEVECLVMGFPTHQLEAYLAFLSMEQKDALEAEQSRPPSCLEFDPAAILPACAETHQVLLDLHDQDQRKLVEGLELRTQAENLKSQVEARKLQLQAKLKDSDQWELQESYFNYRALQASWDHKLGGVKSYILKCGSVTQRLEELQMRLQDCRNETLELDHSLGQNLQLLARIFQHNQDLLARCATLQAQVRTLTSSLEPPLQDTLPSGWVASELDKVAQHAAPCAITVTPQDQTVPVPTTKLTIHRLEAFSHFFSMEPVLEALDFPTYKAPDQLGFAACALRQELMNPLPVYRRQASLPVPNSELEDQRKAAERKTSNILASCRKPLDSRLQTVEELRALLEEWWDPPAWTIRLPQPELEGRTLDQWMKEFAKAKAILTRH